MHPFSLNLSSVSTKKFAKSNQPLTLQPATQKPRAPPGYHQHKNRYMHKKRMRKQETNQRQWKDRIRV